MSNEAVETTDTKYGHVSVKRVLDDANYGKLEMSVMVPFIYDPSGTEEASALNDVNARLAFIDVKSRLYTELAIPTVVADDGTITEANQADIVAKAVAVVQGAFPGSTTESTQSVAQQAGPRPQQRSTNGGGGKAKSNIKLYKRLTVNGEKVPNPEWLPAQLKAAADSGKGISMSGDGFYEMWDNRASLVKFGGEKSGNLPWFRDKNGENAIWPPKGHADANNVADNGGYDEEPF